MRNVEVLPRNDKCVNAKWSGVTVPCGGVGVKNGKGVAAKWRGGNAKWSGVTVKCRRCLCAV